MLEYVAALAGGAKFPPLVVFYDGHRYLVADGFHRKAAALRLAATDIECDIRTGHRVDALKFALGCNSDHGLRRTNANKRHAVAMALAEFPNLSDATLAEMCNVSDRFVGSLRRESTANGWQSTPNGSESTPPQVVANQQNQVLQPSSPPPPPTPQTRLGLDGREYRIPPPPPMVRRRWDGRTAGQDPRLTGRQDPGHYAATAAVAGFGRDGLADPHATDPALATVGVTVHGA